MSVNQKVIKVVSRCTKSFSSNAERDFFGIAHITSKDISGAFRSEFKLREDDLEEKYQMLMRGRNKLANEENEVDVSYGKIRYDKDNQPRTHGQFEQGNETRVCSTDVIKQKFVPDSDTLASTEQRQYETKLDHSEELNLEKKRSEDLGANYKPPYRIADVEPEQSIVDIFKLFKREVSIEHLGKYANKPPLTFYFDTEMETKTGSSQAAEQVKIDRWRDKLSGRQMSESDIEQTLSEANSLIDSKPPLIFDRNQAEPMTDEMDSLPDEFTIHNTKVMTNQDFDQSLDEKYDPPDTREGKKGGSSAFDYLKGVRSSRVEPTTNKLKNRLKTEQQPYSFIPTFKLDSMGFRNYETQVPNWSKARRVDILHYIKNSIIYHNYDILAINKPYGIASHEENKGRELIDMNELVGCVAKEMKVDKVYLAHRLDKSTTGILLFATSLERAQQLHKWFRADEIKKTYWCITKGIPDPTKGIIDIPIGEFKIAGKTRSCLAPEGISDERQLAKRFRESRRAVTEYHVLMEQNNVALVEVKPRTGVKHQIRCHLGLGLSRPILGDHKYSHLEKIAPQKLHPQVLNQLQLRQEKVRTLPLHLHAKHVVIPGAKANGETLFLEAPLPAHFSMNMKALKLRVR